MASNIFPESEVANIDRIASVLNEIDPESEVANIDRIISVLNEIDPVGAEAVQNAEWVYSKDRNWDGLFNEALPPETAKSLWELTNEGE